MDDDFVTPPCPKRFATVPLVFLLIWTFLILIGIALLGTSPETLQYFGQFGDMFGSLNALFASFAMCAAIWAALLQNWQIQEQKRQTNLQKRHEEEMLRRAKLEALFFSLDRLRAILCSAHDKMRDSYDHPRVVVPLILGEIWPAFSEAEIFATLYFSDRSEELIPRIQVEGVCLEMESHANKSVMNPAKFRELSCANLQASSQAVSASIKFGIRNAEKIISLAAPKKT